jgi:hypothetical protein
MNSNFTADVYVIHTVHIVIIRQPTDALNKAQCMTNLLNVSAPGCHSQRIFQGKGSARLPEDGIPVSKHVGDKYLS